MRGLECIFILEGPEGSAELWEDEFGYQLYFESPFSRPEFYSQYEFDDFAIDDAFEDAKVAVGLEGWNSMLEDFED